MVKEDESLAPFKLFLIEFKMKWGNERSDY